MNYQRVYNSIVEKAKSENRSKGKGIYYENHHIIPKCLNGSNDKENLVLLTAKEHFVCHKLLIEIYPNNFHVQLAFVIMALNISSTHQRIKLSSRDYKYARELQVIGNAEAKKGNKNRLGKKFPHTEETKKHLSEHFKKHNPKYAFKKGQIPWNKGLSSSEESKEKNRKAHLGKTMPEESKLKNRNSHLGKKYKPRKKHE